MNEARIFGDLKPATVAEFAAIVNDYDLTHSAKITAGWHLLNTPQPSARAALRVAEGVRSIAYKVEQGYPQDTPQWREHREWERLRQRAYHKANRLSGGFDAQGAWSYEVRS
jgi:hypothetical protein